MSEVITATTVMVASHVLVNSVAAPAAAASAATGILAGAGVVGGLMGAAAFGNLLVNLPIWKELESTPAMEHVGFVNANAFEQEFLAGAERLHARILQASTDGIPAESLDTVATLAQLDRSSFVGTVARDSFPDEMKAVVDTVAKLPELTEQQVLDLKDKTADLVERSLTESRKRLHSVVRMHFEATLAECDWEIKDEAHAETGSAYIVVNSYGQRITAHVERNGTITTDLAGYAGRECESSSSQLFESLERRGIIPQRKTAEPHYLLEGGAIAGRVTNAAQILNISARQRASTLRRSISSQNVVPTGAKASLAKKGVLIQRLRNSIN